MSEARYLSASRKSSFTSVIIVPSLAASISAQWVMEHFGRWIRTFHFIPSPRKSADDPLYDNSKVEYMKRMQTIDLLVEDNADNLLGLENIQKKGLLVARPWNHGKRIDSVLAELTGYVSS